MLRGHYGRYHRSIATGEFANVIGDNVKPYFAGTNYDFATGQWGELTFLSRATATWASTPTTSLPTPTSSSSSVERELGKSLGLSVNYVKKKGRDYPAWREIAGTYAQVPFTDALEDDETATGRTFPVFQLTSAPEERQFRISNPAGVGSDVDAVSFNLVKRMTGKWQMNASATWLRSTGRLTDSTSGVTLEQRGGLQFRSFGKNPNDFVNTDGRLTRRRDLVLQGAGRLPAPRGFPGLRELREPRRRPHRPPGQRE